ncbi:hypothetical protein TNCT_139311 [Trichonephila clavata]|uniref:Uncharacterized protein n=1 Tax=Trichonephila clavata TaxID=2740835 RepID=A0A8X6GW72_TRICU|nr:hypothetical protein TNCT_139311 [Trichonephila clavata]
MTRGGLADVAFGVELSSPTGHFSPRRSGEPRWNEQCILGVFKLLVRIPGLKDIPYYPSKICRTGVSQYFTIRCSGLLDLGSCSFSP